MDFKTTLKILLTSFAEREVKYALIGGYALGLWEIDRATADLDFLVLKSDQEAVVEIMSGLNYELLHVSNDVLQYQNAVAPLGSVDFLLAQRRPSMQALGRAVKKEIFSGSDESLSIRVALPEDLVGFKLQAYANQNRDNPFDIADIEILLKKHHRNMSLGLVTEYFKLFELEDLWKDFQKRFNIEE